jgi:hypothetical protein
VAAIRSGVVDRCCWNRKQFVTAKVRLIHGCNNELLLKCISYMAGTLNRTTVAGMWKKCWSHCTDHSCFWCCLLAPTKHGPWTSLGTVSRTDWWYKLTTTVISIEQSWKLPLVIGNFDRKRRPFFIIWRDREREVYDIRTEVYYQRLDNGGCTTSNSSSSFQSKTCENL